MLEEDPQGPTMLDALGAFMWHPISEEAPDDEWVFVCGRLEDGDGFDRWLRKPAVHLAYPMRHIVSGEVGGWLAADCFHLIQDVTYWARVPFPNMPAPVVRMEVLRG